MKIMALLFLGFVAVSANADELSAADAQLLNEAGIALCDTCEFVNGGRDIGYRFASSASVDSVKQWYLQTMPDWSEGDLYGTAVLYKGEPGRGMRELMTSTQIVISKNMDMPEWFSVAEDVTTEVIVMIRP